MQKRPFCFAGIWNTSIDENTGDEVTSFGIFTVIANPLIRRLGYDRMPVILRQQHERRWLYKTSSLWQILDMLHPYTANLMIYLCAL